MPPSRAPCFSVAMPPWMQPSRAPKARPEPYSARLRRRPEQGKGQAETDKGKGKGNDEGKDEDGKDKDEGKDEDEDDDSVSSYNTQRSETILGNHDDLLFVRRCDWEVLQRQTGYTMRHYSLSHIPTRRPSGEGWAACRGNGQDAVYGPGTGDT